MQASGSIVACLGSRNRSMQQRELRSLRFAALAAGNPDNCGEKWTRPRGFGENELTMMEVLCFGIPGSDFGMSMGFCVHHWRSLSLSNIVATWVPEMSKV